MNLIKFFLTMFFISFLTFGGGYQAIHLFRKYFVETEILRETDFKKIIKRVLLIPGSVGLNLSLAIGNILFGQKGIIIACLACILPSIIIITFLSKFIFNNTNKFYKSFVNGIFLCTIALILHTLLYIFKSYDNFNIFSLIMLIIVFLLLHLNIFNNLVIILLTGIIFIIYENFLYN